MTSGSAMLTSLFLIKDLKYGGWRKKSWTYQEALSDNDLVKKKSPRVPFRGCSGALAL